MDEVPKFLWKSQKHNHFMPKHVVFFSRLYQHNSPCWEEEKESFFFNPGTLSRCSPIFLLPSTVKLRQYTVYMICSKSAPFSPSIVMSILGPGAALKNVIHDLLPFSFSYYWVWHFENLLLLAVFSFLAFLALNYPISTFLLSFLWLIFV